MVIGMVSYDINFNASANDKVAKHPLFMKYNMSNFDTITVTEVKADLGNVLATTGSTAIVAYLSWLLRVKALLA
jgi:hypothetical protein